MNLTLNSKPTDRQISFIRHLVESSIWHDDDMKNFWLDQPKYSWKYTDERVDYRRMIFEELLKEKITNRIMASNLINLLNQRDFKEFIDKFYGLL